MRIPWKLFFRALALAFVVVVGWQIFGRWMGPAFEYRDAKLGLPTLKAMEAAGVRFYRDQDWCQALHDGEGVFANTDRSTCALTAESKDVKPLAGAALERWRHWKQLVDKLPYAVYSISIGPGMTQVHQIELSLSSWGRNSLVYSMGYRLPADEPNEMVHTAIDKDWYHVWEDWN